MSDLLSFLNTRASALERGLAERLERAGCAVLARTQAGQPAAMLAALSDCCRAGGDGPARTWAEMLHREGHPLGLRVVEVLAGLHCLDQAVRDALFRELEQKTALAGALDDLSENVDRLRRAYIENASAEQGQERYAAEVDLANRELEQFVYVASHDLQEPLRKIRTFGDRLEAKCAEQLGTEGQECVQRMQNAAARMQALIDGLLMLSRVTTSVLQPSPVDLAQLAREAVAELDCEIRRLDGRVEVGELPSIEADPSQMRQLLQHLVANGLKFRRAEEPPVVRVCGHTVEVPAEPQAARAVADGRCRIVVEDNGIGFEERHCERIFGAFERLHPRDVYEGTGIGLTICRRIVERHGGSISARSAPGRGSIFEVILPLHQ